MESIDDAGAVRELARFVRSTGLTSRDLYRGLCNRRRSCQDEPPGALVRYLYALYAGGVVLEPDDLADGLLALSAGL